MYIFLHIGSFSSLSILKFFFFSCSKPVSPVLPSLTSTPNPRTAPIIPGQDCLVEIPKGNTGLGLSIVGGADTLLVGRPLQPFSLISDVVSCKQKNYGNVVLFI